MKNEEGTRRTGVIGRVLAALYVCVKLLLTSFPPSPGSGAHINPPFNAHGFTSSQQKSPSYLELIKSLSPTLPWTRSLVGQVTPSSAAGGLDAIKITAFSTDKKQ
ncbi:uncharacterized protein UDID_19622 [Ustilago sp. UG-2017a]|nr:uncharacterized protein UDID_19622 [Ustilago sp. UG-2017a]